MSYHSIRKPRHAAPGTTMIEVLVAILVLSIGMLGIAGIQAASLRYAQGGWARAGVAAELSDVADRIRANPSSTTTAYVLADDYATQRSAIAGGTVTAAKNCESVTCTPAELASFHLVQWRLALDKTMPGGAGIISGSRDTGYVATVMWFDRAFLKDTDTTALGTSATCPPASSAPPIAARVCCPAAANAPDGVRCTNMTVVP